MRDEERKFRAEAEALKLGEVASIANIVERGRASTDSKLYKRISNYVAKSNIKAQGARTLRIRTAPDGKKIHVLCTSFEGRSLPPDVVPKKKTPEWSKPRKRKSKHGAATTPFSQEAFLAKMREALADVDPSRKWYICPLTDDVGIAYTRKEVAECHVVDDTLISCVEI